MLLVRRAFRNCNTMLSPGSVVEPGEIKRFKSRIQDRYLVEVDEHNFEEWHHYFLVKHGVDIKPNVYSNITGNAEVSVEPKAEPKVEPNVEPKVIKVVAAAVK